MEEAFVPSPSPVSSATQVDSESGVEADASSSSVEMPPVLLTNASALIPNAAAAQRHSHPTPKARKLRQVVVPRYLFKPASFYQ